MDDEGVGAVVGDDRVDDAAFFGAAGLKRAPPPPKRGAPPSRAGRGAGAGDQGVDQLGELRGGGVLDRDDLDAGVVALDVQHLEHLVELGDVGAGIRDDHGIGLLVGDDARVGRHEAAEGARDFFGLDVLEREDARDQRVGVRREVAGVGLELLVARVALAGDADVAARRDEGEAVDVQRGEKGLPGVADGDRTVGKDA